MREDYRKYFQIEAAELLDQMTAAVARLREDGPQANEVQHLMRLAHTLKGAAYVVEEPRIGDRAHELEEVLGPYVSTNRLSEDVQHQVFRIIDQLSQDLTVEDRSPVAARLPEALPQVAAAVGFVAEPANVRVELSEVQELMTTISEASAGLLTLHQSVEGLATAAATAKAISQRLRSATLTDGSAQPMADQLGARLENLERRLSLGLQAVEREVLSASSIAGQLRMEALDSLEPGLRRAVLTAAEALGKQANFRMETHGERIDAQVLTTLRDPLLHIVRNAVAHGIEIPEVRKQALKPLSGDITLRCYTDSTTLTMICLDDGAGIDVATLRQTLMRNGVLTPQAAAEESESEIMQYIFAPGVSTTPVADAVSGRGFGLDVVRDVVQSLQGTCRVSSEPGRGTQIELRIPLDLYSTPVIECEAGLHRFSVPFASVQRVIQVTPGDIVYGDHGPMIDFSGQLLRLVPAAGFFGESVARKVRTGIAIVVRSEQRGLALQVDRLLGTKVVVRKTLPRYVRALEFVGGVSLDELGTPELILDPARMFEVASPGTSPESAPRRNSILVVDDSLTTRTLEQSILETAGYEVEVAESAEEGLRKASLRQFSLFLVDIEMPGMNGFEFVSAVKANPQLQQVPCILVTSRSGETDKAKGRAVGASDYIVKGDFNQQYLLSRIAELIPQ